MAYGMVNTPGVSRAELEQVRAQILDSYQVTNKLEAALASVDARLELLELMYRTQVKGNPFTVSFSNLTGLSMTGVWNETLKRVEF